MWATYIKTVLITTLACAISAGLIALFDTPFSFENFVYVGVMSFGGIFLFPIMLLTWLNSFINKSKKKTFNKTIKILRLIFASIVGLFIWLLIDFNNVMSCAVVGTKELDISSKLIYYKEHNDMTIALIYFIPICIIISLLHEKFDKKLDTV